MDHPRTFYVCYVLALITIALYRPILPHLTNLMCQEMKLEGRQNPKKLNNYFTIVSNQIDHLTPYLRNLHNNFVSTALHGEF